MRSPTPMLIIVFVHAKVAAKGELGVQKINQMADEELGYVGLFSVCNRPHFRTPYSDSCFLRNTEEPILESLSGAGWSSACR